MLPSPPSDMDMARPSSSSQIDIPMDNNWEYLHGRVDPGHDESILLVESIPVDPPEIDMLHQRNTLSSSDRNVWSSLTLPTILPPRESNVLSATGRRLTSLPSELIELILSFLDPVDLVTIMKTCRYLSRHAKSGWTWKRHVQENIPGVSLTSPFPFNTYRELYIAHDPHWFLPKYKIWFCDYFLTGKIIIVRYDPRRGCIEGYRLVAERSPPTFDPWEVDAEVIIHSFNPNVRLHLDQPVIQLNALSVESLMTSANAKPEDRFCAEIPMRTNERNHSGVFSNFLLARPVEPRPNMRLWPPPTIPARQRVRNASQEAFIGSGHKPHKRSEVSDQSFRIRRWMEMVAGTNSPGVHLGEEVYTYATLDPKLYTPTEEKPYRGIWVGDYSAHGCEFLLMHQPDNEKPFNESDVVRKEDETLEEWEARKKEERIYRGSLEAIKLTGDPNIPRGEYTFVADDISKTGLIRTVTEQRFKGARIVKSRGHIAATMFRDDKYIESQLIMISHNRLAQYWVGFGHISFFERVDIDSFLSPFNDSPPIYSKKG